MMSGVSLLAFFANNVTLCVVMFAMACVFLLAGFPVAFTLGGTALIVAGLATALGVFDFTLLAALPQRVFTIMTNEVLVAVPLFVFMGVMLERSKVAEELLETMGQLFGGLRGGLGISVSVVGALLAASTGIVGATVVTMGLMSLPTMLRRGYDPALACGSISAAGTLGQIIPPSIVLVLLGDQISNAYQEAQLRQNIFSPESVSVGDLFAGGLLPGLMLVGLYIIYQILVAWLRPDAAPAIPRDDVKSGDASFAAKILSSLVPPMVLIISVLGSILAGIATPTEAAAVGAVGALLLAGQRLDPKRSLPIYLAGLGLVGMLILTMFFDLRLTRSAVATRDLIGIVIALILFGLVAWGVVLCLFRTYRGAILQTVMRSTLEISSMVFVILIGAALFSLTFRGLDGDILVENFLLHLPGGAVSAMLVVMAVMFFLGFFIDFLEIIFIVVPIVAPILLQMELRPGIPISPVWLGIMMAVNLQTSFLTPPFGFALFYLRGVAPDSVTTMHIYKGVVPFVAIQLGALLVLWFVPEIATWLPKLIFG